MNDDHKDALLAFERYVDFDRHNIEDARQDLRHVAGDQWDPVIRALREKRGQPVITVNKQQQFVNQIAGDMMQSAPAIELVAVDDDQDEVYVDIMSGLIRQIEAQSNAAAAYNWAVRCQVACGIGHFQILTEYADDSTFDQDIRIKRILDPLSVVWDDGAREIDRSDAMECFVTEMISEEAFKRLYKTDKIPSDFPETGDGGRTSLLWHDSATKCVRVASRWRRVETVKKIGLRLDGKVIDVAELPPETWAQNGIVGVREAPAYKITHQKMSGDGFLGDIEEWAGKHIPIVPVIGNELCVDGRMIRHGIIRHSKDAQLLHNYAKSAEAELVGLQPKAPFLVPSFAVKGHETTWSRANTDNLPFLPYNVDPQFPNLRPTREAPPQGSAAISAMAQSSEQDMYGTTGIYPTSLGQKSNESSGKAILARERQSDTGTYVYPDNFKSSIRRAGEILVDMIPRVFDSTRTVRIAGKDGIEALARINMIQNDPIRGPVIVNDLSAAKFDVRVKVGTNYASARDREREIIFEMLGRNPALWPVIGDLAVESLDGPTAAKLSARLKKTMPAQLVGEGGMEQPPNPAQEAEVEGMLLENELKKADIQDKQIMTMSKAHELGVSVATAGQPEPTAQSGAA